MSTNASSRALDCAATTALSLREALDDEHLARVKRASSTPEAAKEVALVWEFEAATEHLLQRADGEMETPFERHDVAQGDVESAICQEHRME